VLFRFTTNAQNGRFHMDLFEGNPFGGPKDFAFLTNDRIVIEVLNSRSV
jgi:hypothetical protein